MDESSKTSKRLITSLCVMAVLFLCLCATTYALVTVSVSEQDNYFQTGTVEINLNDGKPVIQEQEFRFEPGMTVNKEFFIESLSTWDVYYKIYFENVKGDLASVLQVTVTDGNQVLFSGTADRLSRADAAVAEEPLHVGEKRTLTISFYYPGDQGNETQGDSLSFNLCADAVQTKNNPGKAFD